MGTYNPSQFQTWNLASAANGVNLNSEIARLYLNGEQMLLKNQQVVTADIAFTDPISIGMVRARNGNSAVLGVSFNNANPCNINSPAHGLSNGDYVTVYLPSVLTGLWPRVYPITVVDPANFTVPFDNSGGAGGTCNYIKALKIDLPSAGAGNLERTIIIQQDETVANFGSVVVDDQAQVHLLANLGDHLVLISDGTKWTIFNPQQRAIGPYDIVPSSEAWLNATYPIDITAQVTAVPTAGPVDVSNYLPANTVEVAGQLSLGAPGGTTVLLTLGPTANPAEQHLSYGLQLGGVTSVQYETAFTAQTQGATFRYSGRVGTVNAMKIHRYKVRS